ncbi:MAG: hypothetical protein CL561_00195 [Alphaproteobacteria bacterium]|nr:hypothetical protein [Alphaproteobacteria bacterium]
MKKENPYHHIDVEIGKRIREQRSMLGISQEKLANGCGLTFRQIQKYETGRNRVSMSRLVQIAEVIGVSLETFTAGLGENNVYEITPTQAKAAAVAGKLSKSQLKVWMRVGQELGKAA